MSRRRRRRATASGRRRDKTGRSSPGGGARRAPIREVLGEESQQGLEARGQGPPRGGRLARQLGPEWHERATSLGTEVAQPCGLEGWRGS